MSAVEDVFTAAARLAGMVAAGFIGLGLLFALRPPAPSAGNEAAGRPAEIRAARNGEFPPVVVAAWPK